MAIFALTTGVVYVRSWTGTVTGGTMQFASGSASAPSIAFSAATTTGIFNDTTNVGVGFTVAGTQVGYIASNALAIGAYTLTIGGGGAILNFGPEANSVQFLNRVRLTPTASGALNITDSSGSTSTATVSLAGLSNTGYSSGARTTLSTLLSVTGQVTLSGASTATSNIIPAGSIVEAVATTTTTTITGATGYQVGDGTDVDRWGDITGTAVGTVSGSANFTADPRWWTAAARAITLTAKTSNFTGGVVQVTVFYRTAVGT